MLQTACSAQPQGAQKASCSPPLSISERKGIKGTSPALGSEANRQKQFSTQLKIKLHNALPLELQTSERCRVQKATRHFHGREIHPGLLKMKTAVSSDITDG